jgi:uncharacterized Zn finger protein
MDNMTVYCSDCKTEVEHEVVEMREGENCWLVITVKCSKCGKVHELNLYS